MISNSLNVKKKNSYLIKFFLISVLLIIFSSKYSLSQLDKIANKVNTLYQHLFIVSNAAHKINSHLISMHRYMKDVVLATNEHELEVAINIVNTHEKLVLNEFKIIFDHFLGNKDLIRDAYQAVLDWKVIRKEVIDLVKQGGKK